MSNSIATKPQRSKRAYNPNRIRRRCRLVEVDASRVAHFAIYSMTREGRETQHHPAIDLQTGDVRCTCEHYSFKLAHRCPTVHSDTSLHCKHISRSLEILDRHGITANRDAPACIHCGSMSEAAYVEVTDDTGNLVIGHSCKTCQPAPCAHRAPAPCGPCARCGDMDALEYFDETDGAGEETGKSLCNGCVDALNEPLPDFDEECDKAAEAAYFRTLDAAEDYAAFVERQAQAEAAEQGEDIEMEAAGYER